MIALEPPSMARHQEWLELASHFPPGGFHGSAVGRRTVEELSDAGAFQVWLDHLADQDRGVVREGQVPATAWWVVEREGSGGTSGLGLGDAGRLVGVIHLRHRLNDFLLREGGHIGYAVHPAHRGHGVASAALGLVLDECRVRGIDPVLVTTDDDNVASSRVVQKAGGVLEDVRDGKRRYWIHG